MYAAAIQDAYRQPSEASRCASPTYTATKIATIVSRNSVVLNPDFVSVKVLRSVSQSVRRPSAS